jgi:hypothetical protein
LRGNLQTREKWMKNKQLERGGSKKKLNAIFWKITRQMKLPSAKVEERCIYISIYK